MDQDSSGSNGDDAQGTPDSPTNVGSGRLGSVLQDPSRNDQVQDSLPISEMTKATPDRSHSNLALPVNQFAKINLLRHLLQSLPSQLANAQENDFPVLDIPLNEEDVETYSVAGVYHNVFASIFGQRYLAEKTAKISDEERSAVHAVSLEPVVPGTSSPVQRAMKMDGSHLWGRGPHAIKIADGIEQVLTLVPNDGPMLKWLDDLIAMALASYSFFCAPVSIYYLDRLSFNQRLI
jgi:hypothetical protein